MLDAIKKENAGYCKSIINRHYGQAARVKLARVKFGKEIKCAALYGALNAAQTILEAHKENPYNSVDEMRGDLMNIITGSYDDIKRNLGLRLPGFDVDKALKAYEGIE